MTGKILWNEGWEFSQNSEDRFQPVRLPHDWLIGDASNFYKTSIGYYRKRFHWKKPEERGHLFLRFDGVYMDSELFVNGMKTGEWKYGYTAFEFEITGALKEDGENEILLKVCYQSPNSRWYSGAGIHRDVFLIEKNASHFISDGISISTRKQDNCWHLTVTAEVSAPLENREIRHSLYKASDLLKKLPDFKKLNEKDVNEKDAAEKVPDNKESVCIQTYKAGHIIPWKIESPALYVLRSELWENGILEDVEETRFGFREICFSPESGFSLNGTRVTLRGACLHHDLGCLGAAVYPDAIRRQLRILREMGVNALRCAHNPPADVFMDIADEMGFLVMSEFTDVWERVKTRYDYARFFPEWVEKDVASWVRRDRNHPSLIMWSLGNEIYDTQADPKRGEQLLTMLTELVRRHDPEEHGKVTFCSNYMSWEETERCVDQIKLIGYNYGENLYEDHHRNHPDWMIYGSETCSTVQSRGVYHFPLEKNLLSEDDLQCSALGNSATSWGAKQASDCILNEKKFPYTLGQFLWAGFDYLGEPTPYHTKSSHFGHVDTAGFPKDSYYLFQAAWTSPRNCILHLFPYWDFNEGQIIDVRVCTNAYEAELFLNGKSHGRRLPGDRYLCDWKVPYEKGEICAIAYNCAGQVIKQTVRCSFGEVASLKVEKERMGKLIFASITAADSKGNPVENANSRVKVEVKCGKLLGLDNGDSTDYDFFQGNSRRLFQGKLLAVVEGEEHTQISVSLETSEIPVRKVELSMEKETGTSEFVIHARIMPENATFRELSWRLTDASGIDSLLGFMEVSSDGLIARITPKADGEVYVRCSPINGKKHSAFISCIPINFSGYGKPFLYPYSFVSAGLYQCSNVELTPGNERGIATLRQGESHIGFQDLDFGNYGSDEVTMWVFAMIQEAVPFEIWEGMPLSGGKKLFDGVYTRGSEWNTYIEQTFRIPKRLKGIVTLAFVFRQKVHFKGFSFKKYEKAFQTLEAASCDQITGDSFFLCEDTGLVKEIGNNVTLTWLEMDFGEKGSVSLELCYQSACMNNSVRLIFGESSGERADVIQMLQLSSDSSGPVTRTFPLSEKISGVQKVSLLFLPGTSLDLHWIHFRKSGEF
ncbi:MAG: DUF4982 domain-containing protein [Hungatella sp.]|jgi:beta-galactosidase|nr:DUF4982 domain-containing protein [Hungatella sp.]